MQRAIPFVDDTITIPDPQAAFPYRAKLTRRRGITKIDAAKNLVTKVDGDLVTTWSGVTDRSVIRLGDSLFVHSVDLYADVGRYDQSVGDVDLSEEGRFRRLGVHHLTDPRAVAIWGEEGVGKERLARWLHLSGKRAAEPFVKVACAPLAGTRADDYFVGVRYGDYPGALYDRVGAYEIADGGVVYLEDVDSLNHQTQMCLSRLVENGELGGRRRRIVNVMTMSSSRRRLKELVKEGAFAESIAARLVRYEVHVPALIDRKYEIPTKLEQIRRLTNAAPLSADFVERCLLLGWPGNDRQLEQLVTREAVLAAKARRQLEHLGRFHPPS